MGVVASNSKNRSQSKKEEQPNWICYYSNGTIVNMEQSIADNPIIEQGVTLSVEIDFDGGVVNWLAYDEIVGSVHNALLWDKRAKWVPYLYLKKKSIIAILG